MPGKAFKFSPAAKQRLLDHIIWSIASDVSGGFDLNSEQRVVEIEKLINEDLVGMTRPPCEGIDRDGRNCGNPSTDYISGSFYCWVHNPNIVAARIARKTKKTGD